MGGLKPPSLSLGYATGSMGGLAEPPEVIGVLGTKPPVTGGWGSAIGGKEVWGRLLQFFNKIMHFMHIRPIANLFEAKLINYTLFL